MILWIPSALPRTPCSLSGSSMTLLRSWALRGTLIVTELVLGNCPQKWRSLATKAVTLQRPFWPDCKFVGSTGQYLYLWVRTGEGVFDSSFILLRAERSYAAIYSLYTRPSAKIYSLFSCRIFTLYTVYKYSSSSLYSRHIFTQYAAFLKDIQSVLSAASSLYTRLTAAVHLGCILGLSYRYRRASSKIFCSYSGLLLTLHTAYDCSSLDLYARDIFALHTIFLKDIKPVLLPYPHTTYGPQLQFT